MKKRLRKKLHVKEFAEYGCFFVVYCKAEERESVLDKTSEIVEKYDVWCWGGGNGQFMMPECEPNYVLPKFVEEVALCSTLELPEGMMMFCLMSKNRTLLPDGVADDIRKAYSDSSFKLKINPHVNLWPRIE